MALVHQLGVAGSREFEYEVIFLFWSDVWDLWHRHGGHKWWILNLWVCKELMPRLTLFKVQVMGHG